jgi:hypothetical protein
MQQSGVRLNFTKDGAERFPAQLCLDNPSDLEQLLGDLPVDRAGLRLHGVPQLRPLLASDGVIGSLAATILGPGAHPVRAVLFDKTAATNWSLPWHQDRTIAVRHRIDVAGFGPWTVKTGLPHVEPPIELLAGMVTLRVHIDPVPASNAPLLVAPGSHKNGRISVASIGDVVERCGITECLADPGDVWLYATPMVCPRGVIRVEC